MIGLVDRERGQGRHGHAVGDRRRARAERGRRCPPPGRRRCAAAPGDRRALRRHRLRVGIARASEPTPMNVVVFGSDGRRGPTTSCAAAWPTAMRYAPSLRTRVACGSSTSACEVVTGDVRRRAVRSSGRPRRGRGDRQPRRTPARPTTTSPSYRRGSPTWSPRWSGAGQAARVPVAHGGRRQSPTARTDAPRAPSRHEEAFLTPRRRPRRSSAARTSTG